MAVSTPEVLWISVTEYDISEIPTANSTFSTMPDSIVTLVTSSEVRELLNFKMEDIGPEVLIFCGHLEFQVEVKLVCRQLLSRHVSITRVGLGEGWLVYQ